MKCLLILFAYLAMLQQSVGQQTSEQDTTRAKAITIEGYIDTYYAYDFNKPISGDRPYFVSMAKHNELSVNLAYLAIKYASSRLRARLAPGVGTYMNANYVNEPAVLKNIVEAYAGVKLWRNKNIWLDVGIFNSHYTNESAISKDQLTYTRSFSPEYVPYYLLGIKLTLPLHEKLNAYLYLINGWQQIDDQNKGKSLGTQLEYRPTDFWLINWSTYVGSEQSSTHTEFRTRYFSDIYATYSKEKWSATSCIYYGLQQRSGLSAAGWWQVNMVGQYSLSKKISIAGRLEYFSDPEEVQIVPITGISGFSSYSSSFGLNFRATENILFRGEGRAFFSEKEVYERNSVPVKNSNLLTLNLTAWF